nr:MAG TPA: hypothetical protein [Caudoviricetes sp.]
MVFTKTARINNHRRFSDEELFGKPEQLNSSEIPNS